MSVNRENLLAHAASAYLRSARHQPVDWYEWGAEAFARAQREDKPVLLDIGAVWCHWCHVMDRESYENPETAAILNEHFVAIKVDRDERPDVDTRYQAVVAAISGQAGWPLTAVLTPDGKPFFGGTYFPAEERYGRPSFGRVLRSLAEAYRTQRNEVEESGESVLVSVAESEVLSGHEAEPGARLLATLVDGMLQHADMRNGGFGAQPKFPHATALDLLVDVASRPGPLATRAGEVVRLSLRNMAAGGICDQLAGGFHRYSVDERWRVPHFEKMAYDNSELLRVYTHAFQSFVDEQFARTAAGVVRWMEERLSDRERGGFYTAQDADASPDDDGNYFTWTLQEAEAVLSPEQFAVAVACYDLRAVGDMPHDPARNVLHSRAGAAALAAQWSRPEWEVQGLLDDARKAMLAARLQRPAPKVDTTLYTGWNGLCVSAFLAAGRALGLPEATAFAIKTLNRLLKEAWQPGDQLRRVIAYGTGVVPAKAVPAVLEDYAFLGAAALDAWEVTGEFSYFAAARHLGDELFARFHDAAQGGFYDTQPDAAGEHRIGALATQRKPLQDAPTPAGNPAAATLLLRLDALCGGQGAYRDAAMRTLSTFAGVVEHLGLNAAGYAQALQRFLQEPVQVCVVGSDELAEELHAVAIARFLLNKSVIRLRPEQLQELPPVLAKTLPHVPGILQRSVAVVCRGSVCLPPVDTPDSLLELLQPAVQG